MPGDGVVFGDEAGGEPLEVQDVVDVHQALAGAVSPADEQGIEGNAAGNGVDNGSEHAVNRKKNFVRFDGFKCKYEAVNAIRH